MKRIPSAPLGSSTILLLSVILSLVAPSDVLSATDSVCENRSTATIQKRIPIPENVNYFIRSSPATREVSFATENGNAILNLDTGKLEKVVGNLDPVLSPDGQILSVPKLWRFDPSQNDFVEPNGSEAPRQIVQGITRLCQGNGRCSSMGFAPQVMRETGEPYDTELISFYLRTPKGWKFLARDTKANANYQSIGVLGKTSEKTDYRVIYETNGKIMAQHHVLAAGELKAEGMPKQLCPDMKLVIPALSKDGRGLSGFDPVKAKTVFIDIGENGDKCEVKDSVPFLVAKADFSPDSSRIAYHIDRARLERTMRTPSDANDLQAMVFDRKTKTPILLPTPKGENAYYPVFIDNMTLAFVSATKSEPKKFSVNIVSIAGDEPLDCVDCYKEETETGQIAALLGYLRGKRCETTKSNSIGARSLQVALSDFAQMKTGSCQQLARECDETCLKNSIKDIRNNSRWVGGAKSATEASIDPLDLWNPPRLEALTPARLQTFCETIQTRHTSPAKTVR